MYDVTIIENIIKDLRKIEYALRVEQVDATISESIAVIIIKIYMIYIINNDDKNNFKADTLSEIYFIFLQYYETIKFEKMDIIIEDILSRIKKIIK